MSTGPRKPPDRSLQVANGGRTFRHRVASLRLIRRRSVPAVVLFIGLSILFASGGASYPVFEAGTAAVDGLFALSVLLALRSVRLCRLKVWLAVLALSYLVGCGVYAVGWNDTDALDYVQASKFLWYLLAALIFSAQRRPVFDPRDVLAFSRFVLLVFFFAYAVKRLAFGQDRPVVLVENNFELIFVALLFYATYILSGRIRVLDLILLGGAVALSGSRSSAIVLVVVIAFCIPFRRFDLRTLLAGVGLLLVTAIALTIFRGRSEGAIDTVDRYNFLQVFLYATRDWNLADFLVGSPRLTALPPESCHQLAFYERLFSYSGDGRCYSVILHSFNLRVIYDHGLLVFGFCLYVVWLILRGIPVKARVCVTLVILLTGMSVSALNNVYVALALAFLASSRFSLPTASRHWSAGVNSANALAPCAPSGHLG